MSYPWDLQNHNQIIKKIILTAIQNNHNNIPKMKLNVDGK